MRAKRSKKYRKIMSAYQIHFSFREPYQVLCDASFLRACHACKMDIKKFLSNTLHGEVQPYVTRCSLAQAVEEWKGRQGKNLKRKKPMDGRNGAEDDEDMNNNEGTHSGRPGTVGSRGRGDGKPEWLPLPTEVPLRYCKHRSEDGQERGTIPAEECLLDLISGQVRGNEVPKNKNHYVLATADVEEDNAREAKDDRGRAQRHSRGRDVRAMVRMVPGVPVVYVKRSVMVLEELSGSSERMIRGVERDKFTQGLVGAVQGMKRKRGAGVEGEEDGDQDRQDRGHKRRILHKAKAPNPLSVKKKVPRAMKRANMAQANQTSEAIDNNGEPMSKKDSGSRKRGKRKPAGKVDAEGGRAVNTASAAVTGAVAADASNGMPTGS